MNRFLYPLFAVCHVADTEPVEIMTGLYVLVWGAIMLLPGEQMAMSPRGYAVLLSVPYCELVFGSIALGVGVYQLRETLFGCVCARARAARCLCFWYALLCIAFLISGWIINCMFYLQFTFACAWVVFRLSGRKC